MSHTIPDLIHGKTSRHLFWMMRQAGRYLPEYKATRAEAGDFLSLCYNPELACEVTLQPIRRFDCDAAIIFSDILVVLQAMGQKLWFEEGEGPRLGVLNWVGFDAKILEPVYEAIRMTRSQLPAEKTLIGFAGAPWTLLLYALQGKGGEEFKTARHMVEADMDAALEKIDTLSDAIITHLSRQIEAGCDTVQLFDSWASFCPIAWQQDFIIHPARKIVSAIKAAYPDVVFIAFPKGLASLRLYAETVRPDVLGIDQFTPLKPDMFPDVVLQGNLDPMILKAGGEQLDKAVDAILETMNGYKHIFNLGHGIDKDTPIAHVERVIERVRA